MIPKYGTTLWNITNSQLYMFGGYYDDKTDFHNLVSDVCILTLEGNYYHIEKIPKSKLSIQLRPKAHYVIQKVNNENLVIYGGYGR